MMFTGIVREMGKILAHEHTPAGSRLCVGSRELISGLAAGDSVSLNGVCLTVAEKNRDSFWVDLAPETIRRTSLGRLSSGDDVNLEVSARASDLLGGHIVQGHVDETGSILAIRREGNSSVYRIGASPEVLKYCAWKASIAVNGVSLTISGLDEDSFEVTLIPHTMEVTNFRQLQVGDPVNLEVDVISKYVESHVRRILGTGAVVLLLCFTGLWGGDFSPGPRTILVYSKQNQINETQLVVRLARYMPDIVLEWETESHQGTVQLYRNAVERGRQFSLNGLFEVGVETESADEMTLWLSRRIFQELRERGSSQVVMNRLKVRFNKTGQGTEEVLINKESVQVPVIYVEDARNGRWIFHRDPENPLLIGYESKYLKQRLNRVSTSAANRLRWIDRLPPVR